MSADLGKPELEGWLTDIAAVRRDIEGVVREVESWASPRRVALPWTLWPGRAQVVPEPLGAVLVIGPWNYPVRCLVLPLAFALAAGNVAAAKPSELAPSTSALLARLLRAELDAEAVSVVEGGPEVGRQLLAQRWDHIFFTGGASVGRSVMTAAASHLTPVTLELGGKNPAIVTANANLTTAARRIAWGKFLNAGQTCVAPDFVLVERAVEGPLVAALAKQVAKWSGDGPGPSPNLARVVNPAHFGRLTGLLAATSGEVVAGGAAWAEERYLAPTLVRGVGWDDALMQDEIFGPILPVVSYTTLDEALDELEAREKPLAVYVYTRRDKEADRVIARTSSGSVCVNHNAVQLGVPALPFGGVGASGMGAYHGQAGFAAFTHYKAVLRKPAGGEAPLMYPPYTKAKEWVLRQALR
jgi:aldehyde dehydrogenase (NAD+)